MHILAPGGRLEDLVNLSRDDLPRAGLSPTHMEAIQGFAEWHKRGITPVVGLLMWYLESVQREDGSFLRTEDATLPSVGVAVRYLQIAGQLGIHRGECESVDRAARWLEDQIGDDGLVRMPIAGLVDFGMLARTIRSLNMVSADRSDVQRLAPACKALDTAQTGPGIWPTYPDGEPSTGATSLAIATQVECSSMFVATPDLTWLMESRNTDGGWGEYSGSPSRADNTFWATRACVAAGVDVSDAPLTGFDDAHGSAEYTTAMTSRVDSLLHTTPTATGVERWALESLTDEVDRYAVTAVFGLTLSERPAIRSEEQRSVEGQTLPVRTPEFIRREPPLYDQLAETTSWPWWTRLVERSARSRVAETSIGWMAGLSAAIALIGEELVNGLASLPYVPLIAILFLETLVVAGWLMAQQRPNRRFHSVMHLAVAIVMALLLVLLIKNPEDVHVPLLPTTVLTLLLAIIIEAISVATDKADLLNRLNDD